ncbi:hypothetical protein BUALT_Bualt05G0088400 [Buddleja alternifolia]|uniref:BHLH domain-containing protein n=1 Tax=Buddleja alternifolia TaxID=168488 RepID=A0AAV6XHV4_9LAMI|nr:hypothetical protein BUALT_Bualt05G0088400 [Buddleja alternifolia]
MCTAKSNCSVIKQTLKSLCCTSNGSWCYGIFWGFHHTNPLLLTLKDGYYEEEMGPLIDNMLLQVHVMGRGVIGQAAFTQNHQWMHSDSHHQRHNNSLVSFESVEDDSEFYYQLSLGIKTIALISVEQWGVVQFGSTQKMPERIDFVDQVKQLFTKMDKHRETNFIENRPPSDNKFLDARMQFSSLSPRNISHYVNQNFQDEGFVEANDSLLFPSHSFPSTSELLLESANFFDCSASQAFSSNNSDCSVPTSSWPHLVSTLKENVPFSKPSSFELSRDKITAQNSTSLLDQTDCRAQMSSGLLTLEALFQENDFVETQFTTLLSTNVSQATGLIPLSNLGGYNSPIHKSENLPTNSIQSSLADAFGFNHEIKCSSSGFKIKPESWNETLIPFTNDGELNYSRNESECISEKCDVGSKVGTSNSLFSKLGLDQLLDGSASTSTSSCLKSRFEDQSSSALKRRKIDKNTWSHNQVKIQNLPNSYGNNSEPSIKEQCLSTGGSYSIDIRNTSSSKWQEKPAKPGKKKAKPGTKPRPKDRQMIQDRLAELRELIPNGEKMSIDRLLERTIRHLNFMHCLTKHAETLKQADKPKSRGIQNDRLSDSGGGVTWACEVGDQTMVCPLIVEDLNTPGQMLIEIVCEEEGFFLEIVDIVRGFGLTILKGVMEARETKMWAHFIVESEGTRRVTRHETFSSLIQLLQMTGQSTTNAEDHYCNVISGEPLFDNREPDVSFPVNLADTLQCANL